MKSYLPLTVRVVFVLLLVGSVIVIILNQSAIGRLRGENAALLGDGQEAQRLALENHGMAVVRQESEEAEKLGRENQALPKLRNEVRQLRRQVEEMEQVRAENGRLLALRAGNNAAAPGAVPADFIVKSALVDAGLGTPEVAVQTIFLAMCQGNIERLRQCVVDDAWGSKKENIELDRQEMVKEMSGFSGLRIAAKKMIAPDEVLMGLQSSVGGTFMPMKLKLVGGEWKMGQ